MNEQSKSSRCSAALCDGCARTLQEDDNSFWCDECEQMWPRSYVESQMTPLGDADIECFRNVYKSLHGVSPSAYPKTRKEYDIRMQSLDVAIAADKRENPHDWI